MVGDTFGAKRLGRPILEISKQRPLPTDDPNVSLSSTLPMSLSWARLKERFNAIPPFLPRVASLPITAPNDVPLRAPLDVQPSIYLSSDLGKQLLTNTTVTARYVSPQLPVLAQSRWHDEVVIKKGMMEGEKDLRSTSRRLSLLLRPVVRRSPWLWLGIPIELKGAGSEARRLGSDA